MQPGFPVGAQLEDRVRGRLDLRDRFSLGELRRPPLARIAIEASTAATMSPKRSPGCSEQAGCAGKQVLLQDLGREDLPGAVRAGCAPRPRGGSPRAGPRPSGGAARRPARRRSCSRPRLRRRAARARAAPRTGRLPRGGLPRRRRPDPDASTCRGGVREGWSAPSSPDSPLAKRQKSSWQRIRSLAHIRSFARTWRVWNARSFMADERGDGHLLLEGLGREEDHLAPGGRPSARAGWSAAAVLPEPVGASARRFSPLRIAHPDGLHELLLDRAGGRVREGEPFRRCGLARPRDFLGPPDAPGSGRAARSTLALGVLVERDLRARSPRRSRCRRRRGRPRPEGARGVARGSSSRGAGGDPARRRIRKAGRRRPRSWWT